MIAQTQKDSDRQACSGMYSRKSWGGSVDPFIMVKFIKPDNIPAGEDPIVSLVVFEWRDRPFIGKTETLDNGILEVGIPEYECVHPPADFLYRSSSSAMKPPKTSSGAPKVRLALLSLRLMRPNPPNPLYAPKRFI